MEDRKADMAGVCHRQQAGDTVQVPNIMLNNNQKGSFYKSKMQAEQHNILLRDTEISAETSRGLVEFCFIT